MRSSVTLAAEARKRFAAEAQVPIDSVKVTLSLAAYGGSLSLPHEYDGYYPPPYGPKTYDPQPDPNSPNRNVFHADERAQEAQSEEALASFHLERLRVYASDKETWRAVDALAFETIPLAREVRAIRRAVAALEDELAPEERKPWWVCTVYAAGEFPEERAGGSGNGGHLGVKEVLASYFDPLPAAGSATAGSQDDVGTRYAVPDAFGINCTATTHVAGVVAAASDALAQTGVARIGDGQPWLVLKPNGGQTYDMDTRVWDMYDIETRSPGEKWARQVGDIVHKAVEKGVWGGILVGGCCKAGEEELRALSKVLQLQ
jgi:homocysteine S-methyltransferase